jgi:hypothetical protein
MLAVAFAEHDGADASVWKKPTLYARLAAVSRLLNSARAWTDEADSLMAEKHSLHCGSSRHRATPPRGHGAVLVVVVAVVVVASAPVLVQQKGQEINKTSAPSQSAQKALALCGRYGHARSWLV